MDHTRTAPPLQYPQWELTAPGIRPCLLGDVGGQSRPKPRSGGAMAPAFTVCRRPGPLPSAAEGQAIGVTGLHRTRLSDAI